MSKKLIDPFLCGIVLTTNNFNYFAPISSFNRKLHTVFLIMDKDKKRKKTNLYLL